MPNRKNGSNENQSSSHRSSLRRLSSMASFHTFFAGRRSNNVTGPNGLAHSSSTLSMSVSSINQNASVSKVDAKVSSGFSQQKGSPPGSEKPEGTTESTAATKSHYVCLPDDPIGGMPRSRTFSNLPIPTRSKNSGGLTGSRTFARLPLARVAPTRLPSPPASTRQHSHSRLPSAESRLPVFRHRLPRSGTEPLLQPSTCTLRSTAFKENISMSPIKTPPAEHSESADTHSLGESPDLPGSKQTWASSNQSRVQMREASSSSLAPVLAQYARHPAIQIAREHKSSPAYKGVRDRQPTPSVSMSPPPAPAQRWNSQPVLSNTTNLRRNSPRIEIKQPRLLSTRGAPTPLPVAASLVHAGLPASGLSLARERSVAALPTLSYQSSRRSSPCPTDKASPSNLHRITSGEPPAYWCGRVCALTDRLANQDLTYHLTSSQTKSEMDVMHSPAASTARLRRALDILHEYCATPEARDSFAMFRCGFANRIGLPELVRPIVLNKLSGSTRGGDGSGGLGVGEGEKRKVSFIERLLGGKKRRSLGGSGDRQ